MVGKGVKYKQQKRLRKKKGLELSKSDISILQNFIAPLVTAITIVIIQQMFFIQNVTNESYVKMRTERLKEQLPVLNRIMAFTDSFTIYIEQINYIGTYINKSTGEVLHTKDTLKTEEITLPSFVANKEERAKFLNDLGYIKSSIDVLDYSIYIEVENISDFLLKYPLPDFEQKEIFYQSPWKELAVRNEWENLLKRLNSKTVLTINNI